MLTEREVIKALIDEVANVNDAKEDGVTHLWIAAQYGHLEVINLLL